MKKPISRIITVEIPENVYQKLDSKRKKEGVTIKHHVNAILAHYFFSK
jgi:hypothetical protein